MSLKFQLHQLRRFVAERNEFYLYDEFLIALQTSLRGLGGQNSVIGGLSQF